MKKVCVIAYDPIGRKIAGPAIRALEIARALSRKFKVTLATPNMADLPNETFRVVQYDRMSLAKVVRDQDIVYVFGHSISLFPVLKNISGSLVVDIYCPAFFEALESHASEDIGTQYALCRGTVNLFMEQLEAGDFFICATETQRSLWIGMLVASGRINPLTYAKDKTLRSVIDVVPYGLPDIAPVKKKAVLKGVHPSIKENDFVLLWGGGVYDWLDPKTAVRAMALIAKERSDVKLFFMACRHPLPNVVMDIVSQTRQLSDSLGLTEKYVIFNHHWVPYDERADYLLEADIGLCLHPDSIETDYSFRTRIMDCIWAGLPVISTRGGFLSELVEEKQLGVTVDYENAEELAQKVLSIVRGELPLKKFRDNISSIRDDYAWNRVVEPLERFCENPFRKIDDDFLIATWRIRSPFYYYKRMRMVYKRKGLKKFIARFVELLLQRTRPYLSGVSDKLTDLFISSDKATVINSNTLSTKTDSSQQEFAISVIIPTYNGRHLLEICLPSLAQQNQKDFEVIVVDNGSNDGTPEFLAKNYPQVQVLVYADKLGFARAVNAGVRVARGDYIALLNNDTEVDPNWLTALKNRLDDKRKLGICASKLVNYHQRNLLDGAGDGYDRRGDAFRLGWGLPDSSQANTSYKIFGACAGAAMYRKSMLDEIGLLDEDFMMYYEDVDLNFRAQLYGYECEFVPEALVYHIGSASSGSVQTPGTTFLIARNSLYVIMKNYPLLLLLKNLGQIIQSRVQFARHYYRQSHEMGKAYTDGLLSALKSTCLMFKKRLSIQKNRVVSLAYIEELFRSSEELLKAYNNPVTPSHTSDQGSSSGSQVGR